MPIAFGVEFGQSSELSMPVGRSHSARDVFLGGISHTQVVQVAKLLQGLSSFHLHTIHTEDNIVRSFCDFNIQYSIFFDSIMSTQNTPDVFFKCHVEYPTFQRKCESESVILSSLRNYLTGII